MKRLLSLVLLLIHPMLYASSLRITSMGGVTIALRDLENDPFSLNPARAVLIEKSENITNLFYGQSLNENTQTGEYLSNPLYARYYDPQYNYQSNSKSNNDSYGIGDTIYCKLNKSFMMAVQNNYGDKNMRNNSYSKISGKFIQYDIFISSDNLINQNSDNLENTGFDSHVLAGCKLGNICVGLELSKTFLSNISRVNQYSQIDNEYNSNVFTSQSHIQKYEESQFSESIKGGILVILPHTSFDVTTSWSQSTKDRQTADIQRFVKPTRMFRAEVIHLPTSGTSSG